MIFTSENRALSHMSEKTQTTNGWARPQTWTSPSKFCVLSHCSSLMENSRTHILNRMCNLENLLWMVTLCPGYFTSVFIFVKFLYPKGCLLDDCYLIFLNIPICVTLYAYNCFQFLGFMSILIFIEFFLFLFSKNIK